MRRLVAGAVGARAAFRIAVPAALVATAAGSVFAAAPAVAAARGPAAPSCTVSWIGSGFGSERMWTTPSNWSTGKVPGPSDDVCIGANPAGTGAVVLTPISITVHSLQIGAGQGIDLEGTTSNPVTATVATSVTIASGSRFLMTDASIKAAQISNQGGTISTEGTCSLTSPGIDFGGGGQLQAFGGTTTLTSLAQLSNGTLTGAGITAANATVVLPGDITNLASANISVGPGTSAIDDPAGHNALAGLSMIDKLSSLTDDNSLTLTGSDLVVYGNVDLAGGTVAIGGPFTQVQGTLTLSPGTTLSASPVTIDRQASMIDEGTVTGDVVNDGILDAYAAHVTGNYTQAASGTLLSGFGKLLAVTGTATLAGSVSATEIESRTFDSSPVITFSSLTGGFTAHNLGIKLVTRANEVDAIVVPQLTAAPRTVATGHAVTVNGGGFTYPQTVSIFLDHASGTPLATANVGVRGTFTAAVTIPASTGAGPHRLIAVETDGVRASASVTVR